MGSKFSKAGGHVKSVTDIEGSSQTVNEIRPALSSRNSADNPKHEVEILPAHLDRSRSFSKRFRRSCRNWAVGRGIVADKKTKETEELKETIESITVASQDLVLIDLEEDQEDNLKNAKEADIGSIVAQLVLDAKKKKTLSKNQLEETLNTKVLKGDDEKEALVTLDKPKVVNEIQVTLEEDTVEITTPSILHTEETGEFSEVTEAGFAVDTYLIDDIETNAKDKLSTRVQTINSSSINFQETSFDVVIDEESIPNIRESTKENEAEDVSYYFDIKVDEEFVVSAGYDENDVFKEDTTDSLVTVLNMTDLDQQSFSDFGKKFHIQDGELETLPEDEKVYEMKEIIPADEKEAEREKSENKDNVMYSDTSKNSDSLSESVTRIGMEEITNKCSQKGDSEFCVEEKKLIFNDLFENSVVNSMAEKKVEDDFLDNKFDFTDQVELVKTDIIKNKLLDTDIVNIYNVNSDIVINEHITDPEEINSLIYEIEADDNFLVAKKKYQMTQTSTELIKPKYELSEDTDHHIESFDNDDDSEVESDTDNGFDSYIKHSEKISAIDFLLDNDDDDYLEEFFHVKCVQNPSNHIDFGSEFSFGPEDIERENDFQSLNLKTVCPPDFDFQYNSFIQLHSLVNDNANLEKSSLEPIKPQHVETDNDLIETINKDVEEGKQSNLFKNSFFEVKDFENNFTQCKVNPLFMEEIPENKDNDEHENLINADDMLKEFFDQLSSAFSSKDSHDETKENIEPNFNETHLLDFYMNDQMSNGTNSVVVCGEILRSNSVGNLESIEEEEEKQDEEEREDEEEDDVEDEGEEAKEEDNQEEEDEQAKTGGKKSNSGYVENLLLLYIENKAPVSDHQSYIKTAIRGMFPMKNSALDTTYEHSLEPKQPKEINIENVDHSDELTNTENCIVYEETDNSDDDSASFGSEMETYSYKNKNEKTCGIQFLTDDGLDHLDNEQFFTSQFDQNENVLINENLHTDIPNSVSHNFEMFSHSNFGTQWTPISELSDEECYSESSSECQSIDSVRNVETDKDAEQDRNEFICEILSSVLTQISSKDFLHIETKKNINAFDNEMTTNHGDEFFCESPFDDFHSDAGSEKDVSTDEGIEATSDDDYEVEEGLNTRKVSIGEEEEKSEMYYHCVEQF